MGSIMDKLYKRVEERGVVCVGLDTALDYIPSLSIIEPINAIPPNY